MFKSILTAGVLALLTSVASAQAVNPDRQLGVSPRITDQITSEFQARSSDSIRADGEPFVSDLRDPTERDTAAPAGQSLRITDQLGGTFSKR